MEIQRYDLVFYEISADKFPFKNWFDQLDDETAAKIAAKLDKLALGYFGDTKSVGHGIFELKISLGPGYRIYYSQVGKKILLLLTAGNKSSQKRDIKKASEYLKNYRGKNESKK